VLPEHRVNSAEVIQFIEKLLEFERTVDDPIEEIQAIFEKILKWKQKAGNLEE